jgi:hypothetical protein
MDQDEAKKYSAEELGMQIPCRIWLPSEGRSMLVDLADLPPQALTIDVIAHALSTKNRYNGHTPWPYSVALHSVVVSLLTGPHASPRLALEGLLHDAAEVFVGDVISPIKRKIREQFAPIEAMVDAQIRTFYGLPIDESPEVKDADTKALWIEQHLLQGRPLTAVAQRELLRWEFETGESVARQPIAWGVSAEMFTLHYETVMRDLVS